jgi:hypothetical protein
MDHALTAGRDRVRAVRWWWRAVHPPPSLGHRLDVLYSAAITTAIFGALAYGTASAALAQVVTPSWLATYGPPLALVAVALTAGWGAYQGPVVFTVPDVGFLLGAPLSRRALSTRRLALALIAGALVGAVLSALLLVGLGGEGRGVDTAQVAGLAIALAELGALGVAAAWAVQRSARIELALRRATWPVAAVAAGLAAIGLDIGIWALAPLTLLVAAAVVAAFRSAGRCSAERHMRRAEARAAALASLASFDARTARLGLVRAAVGREPRTAAADLRRLRALAAGRGALVIAWRDALTALRAPARVAEAAALIALGTVLTLAVADKPLAVLVGVVLVYFGAALLLGPLRAELDVPDRTRVLLLPRVGNVVLAHVLVPAVLTTAAAALAAAGCAIASSAEPAAALVAAAVAPGIAGCAAMSARRGGRVRMSLMAAAVAGDPTGGAGTIMAWLAAWPSAAALLAAVPAVMVESGGSAGLLPALLWTVAGSWLVATLLRRDPDPA